MVTHKHLYTSSSSTHFSPYHGVLEGKEHLLMRLIELLLEIMKEIQTCEGEKYIPQTCRLKSNDLFKTCFIYTYKAMLENLIILLLVMEDIKSLLKITSSETTKLRSLNYVRTAIMFICFL